MDDLVTARLVLHRLTDAEAERIAAGTPGDDDRWAFGYPAEGDVSGARLYLDNRAIVEDPGPFGTYEIRGREDGMAVGSLGFHAPPDESGCVTIGYGLIPSARGKGYATEALRALLDFARGLGVTCVKGDADAPNVASQRVMAAAGMQLVAEDDALTYFEITWSDDPPPPAPAPAGSDRIGA